MIKLIRINQLKHHITFLGLSTVAVSNRTVPGISGRSTKLPGDEVAIFGESERPLAPWVQDATVDGA